MDHSYRTMRCMECGVVIEFPVSCGNRFCEVCTVSRRSRIRRKVQALMQAVELHHGETVKFLTLTIPNQSDPSSMLSVIQQSFRRLRQRAFFKSRVRGGITFYEITGEPGDWHVHLHAIIVGRYIPVEQLSQHWRAVSPGMIVHIKRLPIRAAVNYVTKYAMKTTLPLVDQFAVSRMLKGRRLFQPFGSLHAIAVAIPPATVQCSSCGESHWAYNGGCGAVTRLFGGNPVPPVTPWMGTLHDI